MNRVFRPLKDTLIIYHTTITIAILQSKPFKKNYLTKRKADAACQAPLISSYKYYENLRAIGIAFKLIFVIVKWQ